MTVLDANLVEQVAESISRYNMLVPGGRVGIAVSGGADSVVLLHILHRLSSTLGIQVMVLHVNHQLRDTESDEDESFVRALAESLRLEAMVEKAPIAGGNLEQEARLQRRAFFRRAMQQHNLNCVALGHTRSDQAETVLFRLLRGSGLAGLAGMRPVTPEGLIRPLLHTSREEVRAWALAEGIEWREDSSNQDSRFARNRLRNEAIPLLREAFNPNLEAVLAGTARLAGDEEDYWIQQIEPIYRQITKRTALGSFFQIAALEALPIAIRRRVIRRALADLRGDLRSIDMEHVEAILAICSSRHGHDRVIVPGVDALRSFGNLLLAHPGEAMGGARHYHIEIKNGVECELPFRAGFLSVNRVTPSARNCVNFEEEQRVSVEIADLDERAVAEAGGSLAVRNWEPGDELRRAGHQGVEKVKSLFQEYKILLWERRHWPVVAAAGEIVWVRRFGPAARFKASGEDGAAVRLIVPAGSRLDLDPRNESKDSRNDVFP